MNCRHCAATLEHRFLDLGYAPPSNAYRTADELSMPEATFPLRLYVCQQCWLVQTEDYAQPSELFTPDYAYFSSVSHTWLEHASDYFEMASERFQLGPDSLVLEIGANDGYLLKHFVNAGIPCLGIEPTASTAAVAESAGITVIRDFFDSTLGSRLASEGKRADLVIGNNVYAHVPDINGFTKGLRNVLKPGGTVTLEFPHLMQLIEHTQFDTVYHEHFSYLLLSTVCRIFDRADLRVVDVEQLDTHGGSLRVYGCRGDDPRRPTEAVERLLAEEQLRGLQHIDAYLPFQGRVERIKDDLLEFLIAHKRAGRRVGAYGAAAKGNTLLNFAGVRPDLLPYVGDAAPSKQGKFLPGSHIPIVSPKTMNDHRPEIVLVLAWNIAREVVSLGRAALEGRARFFVAVPQLRELQ